MHVEPPLYPPNMNTIEHMWDELCHWLKGVHPQPWTPKKLGHFFSNLWHDIPLESTRALVDSVPHGLHAVVAACGGNTHH